MINTENIEEIFGNPLDGISPEEWGRHAGRLVAIAKGGQGILASADTVDELYEIMQQEHPEESGYLVQSVPNIHDMTAASYRNFCDLFQQE